MRAWLFGHVMHPTGYGRAARELAHSLLAASVELEIVSLGFPKTPVTPTGLTDWLCGLNALTPNPDFVVVHTLPLDCVTVFTNIADRLLHTSTDLITYTTWEGASSPPENVLGSWTPFDAVWMPNEVGWGRLHGVNPVAIPHSYDISKQPAQRRRTDPRYRFYYVGTFDARKNVGALIRTFAHTFMPDDDVELVMHVAGMDVHNFATQLATTGLDRAELPNITLSNKYLTDDQMDQFHADGDCFVSASRGEAWNLPAFDAMMHRSHIIVPRDHGSIDYLQGTSADLIYAKKAPACVDVRAEVTNDGIKMHIDTPQGLDCRSMWLEPDLGAMSSCMRGAFETRNNYLNIEYDHRMRYSRIGVGKQILTALESL